MPRAPSFWYRSKAAWQAWLLTPLSWIWLIVVRIRIARDGFDADVPVICVGNVTVGGAGKTPTVIALVKHLQSTGRKPVVLLRGYGGSQVEPFLLTETSDAKDVGDEALLHFRSGPVVVTRDRAAGARLAQSHGDLIVMDDGLQNPQLNKDISILVVDGRTRFGNGRIFPSGPLRETIGDIQKRIDCVLTIGRNADVKFDDVPNFVGKISAASELSNHKVIAFAGIAQPEKFYATLNDLGADIISAHDFGDHQAIPMKALHAMEARANESDAILVTTEKDHVRLPREWQAKTTPIPIHLEIDRQFYDLIDTQLREISNYGARGRI